MDIDTLKKIHCIGIGGIGVSAIARFFVARGVEVSGSDMGESDELRMLKEKGVVVFSSQDAKNIPEDVECVVYSPAVPKDNVEMLCAKELTIPTYSYPEMLGQLTHYFTGIAVSGTNGKTTTTAILGKILEESHKDPTVIVGGRVSGWDNNLRVGKSDLFVVEGCEYKRSMMSLSPHGIVLTNIEEDHLDYYKDINDIVDAFTDYVARLTEDDILVYNKDDEYAQNVSESTVARTISYGLDNTASVYAKDLVVKDGAQEFTLVVYGEEIGALTAHIPGTFNIYNILAAVAMSLDLGATFPDIQKAVANFHGTWRRFEKVGKTENGTVVISDYAHHPTAIRGTIKATREFFPGKKILVVFQPHHEDRTIKLFDEFVESFAEADEVVISEIYHVRGREEAESKISSKDLVRAIQDRGGVDIITFAKDLETTEKLINKKIKDFDLPAMPAHAGQAGVVLVMGAGDIDQVARHIVQNK